MHFEVKETIFFLRKVRMFNYIISELAIECVYCTVLIECEVEVLCFCVVLCV